MICKPNWLHVASVLKLVPRRQLKVEQVVEEEEV